MALTIPSQDFDVPNGLDIFESSSPGSSDPGGAKLSFEDWSDLEDFDASGPLSFDGFLCIVKALASANLAFSL